MVSQIAKQEHHVVVQNLKDSPLIQAFKEAFGFDLVNDPRNLIDLPISEFADDAVNAGFNIHEGRHNKSYREISERFINEWEPRWRAETDPAKKRAILEEAYEEFDKFMLWLKDLNVARITPDGNRIQPGTYLNKNSSIWYEDGVEGRNCIA